MSTFIEHLRGYANADPMLASAFLLSQTSCNKDGLLIRYANADPKYITNNTKNPPDS